MFEIFFHAAVEKDLRQLSRPGINRLKKTLIPGLASGHLTGWLLVGPLRGYHKYRFSVDGQPYRLVYQLIAPKTLFIIGVGKRGEFYDRIRRRIR